MSIHRGRVVRRNFTVNAPRSPTRSRPSAVSGHIHSAEALDKQPSRPSFVLAFSYVRASACRNFSPADPDGQSVDALTLGHETHQASTFRTCFPPSLLDSPRFEQGGTMPDPAGIGPLSLGRRRFLAVLTGGLLAAPLMA